MIKTAVAGTFNRFHKGHRKLLNTAFENGDFVFIGITSDEMASKTRKNVDSFAKRKEAVEKYALSKKKRFSIVEINDPSPMEKMRSVDVLVVSKETENNGMKIKEMLKAEGKELRLVTIDLVLASNGKKISSSDIVEGIYDTEGN